MMMPSSGRPVPAASLAPGGMNGTHPIGMIAVFRKHAAPVLRPHAAREGAFGARVTALACYAASLPGNPKCRGINLTG